MKQSIKARTINKPENSRCEQSAFRGDVEAWRNRSCVPSQLRPSPTTKIVTQSANHMFLGVTL